MVAVAPQQTIVTLRFRAEHRAKPRLRKCGRKGLFVGDASVDPEFRRAVHSPQMSKGIVVWRAPFYRIEIGDVEC